MVLNVTYLHKFLVSACFQLLLSSELRLFLPAQIKKTSMIHKALLNDKSHLIEEVIVQFC